MLSQTPYTSNREETKNLLNSSTKPGAYDDEDLDLPVPEDVDLGVNSIETLFSSDCVNVFRLVGVFIGVILCVLTVVVPLVYLIYYYKKKGFQELKERIGFDVQPLVLAFKATCQKFPRFNEIKMGGRHKLLMGAQPDTYGGFNGLFKSYCIRTIVSFNTDEERGGNLWMRPPTKEEYAEHGVAYFPISLSDHCPLTHDMLMSSSEAIHDGLKKGDVYVHCKAGQGRSAQGVLAYLIRYRHLGVDEAIRTIARNRPNITLKTSDEVLQLKDEDKRQQNLERHKVFDAFYLEYQKTVSSTESPVSKDEDEAEHKTRMDHTRAKLSTLQHKDNDDE